MRTSATAPTSPSAACFTCRGQAGAALIGYLPCYHIHVQSSSASASATAHAVAGGGGQVFRRRVCAVGAAAAAGAAGKSGSGPAGRCCCWQPGGGQRATWQGPGRQGKPGLTQQHPAGLGCCLQHAGYELNSRASSGASALAAFPPRQPPPLQMGRRRCRCWLSFSCFAARQPHADQPAAEHLTGRPKRRQGRRRCRCRPSPPRKRRRHGRQQHCR